MFVARHLGRLDARRLFERLRASRVTLAITFGWFIVAFATIYFAEGFRPKSFMTPDEAANRLAGALIAKTGRAVLELQFDDPEDAAHPRAWLSQGDYAIPIYPPVSVYFYALITYLRRFGSISLMVLPSSALAVFAAGTARLLPDSRRWLAVFAPALGMPALYWLLRPWMNLCALLTCVCWAFYCWTRWRTNAGRIWLAASMLFVGLGAAVRPDYTAYLLLVSALFTWGKKPSTWRQLLVLGVLAGALALGSNLMLNRLITGNAFKAAYQLAMEADPVAPKHGPLVRFVKLLFFPMTFPGWSVVAAVFVKYWIRLQPLWLLSLGQLALLPLFWRRPLLERVTLAACVALFVLFMISRVDPELFGGDRTWGYSNDSLPRYWSPIYLLAALPPLLFLGQLAERRLFIAGVCAVSLLAAGSLFQVYWYSPQSVAKHVAIVSGDLHRLKKLENYVPLDAIIYSPSYDKMLWSRFHAGNLEDLEKAACSMKRALDNGVPVYFFAHTAFNEEMRPFQRRLANHGISLVMVDWGLRLYRAVARPNDAPRPAPNPAHP
jgi:hypothetical protein